MSEERHKEGVLSPGDLVDHFKVVRLVGRGGMGEVYLARDTHLGRKVALKVVRPGRLHDDEAVERFMFEAKVTARFDFQVLMMGYYNTAFKMGHENYINRLKAAGACGFILPDLPIEEAGELHSLARAAGLAPIILMTPTNSDKRLRQLGEAAVGFVYAVARKGVTGGKTDMTNEVAEFLDRCRTMIDVPLGVGFGVAERADIEFIGANGDIAIIGTAALRAWEEGGETALRSFFEQLGI